MTSNNDLITLLEQLKNNELLSLILFEFESRIIYVLPYNEYIKVTFENGLLMGIRLIDEVDISTPELNEAFIIQKDVFTYRNLSKLVYIIKKLEIENQNIKFTCYYNTLEINNFNLHSSQELKYYISYNMKLRTIECHFNNCFEGLEDFYRNQDFEYAIAYVEKRAKTYLMEEEVNNLNSIKEFLDEIGFNKLVKSRKLILKSRTEKGGFLWDILLRYLIIITINPKYIDDVNDDYDSEVYELINLYSNLVFAEYIASS